MFKNILTTTLSLLLILPVGAQISTTNSADANSADDQQKSSEMIRVKTLDGVREVRVMTQETKEQFKQSLEEARSKVRDRVEAEKTQLKDRLQLIKDENKRQVVEKINMSLAELNDRYTQKLVSFLDRLENLLSRIEERVVGAVSRNLDVASAQSVINDARASIAASRELVKAQAERVYVIDITNEISLRVDVYNARQVLHSDLTKAK
ncbi:MAG: hypothetical protein Q8Q37_01720, partial [bacterium]|nr:hypothetical protein [bacterium]